MTADEQKRLDAISSALASMVKRQQELESRIAFLEFTSGFKAPVPPPLPASPPTLRFEPLPPLAVEPQPDQLETTVGLTWLNRLGVVTLIFGAAFGFKLAVDNGWIGPAMRVALGVFAAMISLFFGDRMWRRGHAIFAQGLMGLGVGLLYLSFYASFNLYYLLPQSAAFALIAMTTIAAGFTGIQYNSQAIALLGLLGGYLTPVLLSTGEDHPWFLFSYTFGMNLGGLALARSRNWKLTEYLSAIATVILYAAWYGRWFGDSNRLAAATFAVAFYAQFAAASSRIIVFAAQFLAAIAAIAVGESTPRLLYLSLTFAAGGLAVAEFRRWRETPPWTLLCFWIPYGFWLASNPVSLDRIFNFELLTIAFAMFFAWTLWWAVLAKRTLRASDLTTFAANAATYFVASYALLNSVHHELMGYFAVALCLLHGAASKLLSKPEDREAPANEPAALAMAVALSFLTLAIPIQFTGFRITIAWALQGAALAWLAARYNNARLNIASWIVFALVIGRLFAFDAQIPSGGFDLRFLTFTTSAAGLWLAARFARSELPALLNMGAPYIAGHFVMLWNLGLEVVTWVDRTSPPDAFSFETMAISILMAVYATMLVVLGVATRTPINRVLGLGLMGIVVAKLYLSDVWQLSRGLRITAFLALGIMLLVISYLYSRFKPVIERLWKNERS